MFKWNRYHIAFLALGLVYLFLPTQNANIDSWYYAACVKHNKELWNSHHLLYNGFGRLWFVTLQFFCPNLEAIAALNMMNSIAAIACLFVLKACLIKLNTEKQTAFWLTLLCGVSFGFMRFATDAETYILPLLFSLIATYYFINFTNWKQFILASFFSCLAILFHQLHIWWALAFIIFLLKIHFVERKKQHLSFNNQPSSPLQWRGVRGEAKENLILAIFLSISFLLFVYFIGYKLSNLNSTFLQFITGEYSKGNAGLEVSFKNVLFTIINFFRSLIQIHGNIFDFLSPSGLEPLFLLILIIVFYYVLFRIKPWQTVHKIENNSYKLLFILALTLHIIFAFLSSANAEFMVMLPFLCVLYLACNFQFSNLRFLKIIVLALFIWNIGFGILPQRILHLNKMDQQVEITLNHPEAYFLWQNKPLVENIITYKKGFNMHHQYIDSRNETFYLQVDSLLQANQKVFMDNLITPLGSRADFYTDKYELNLRNYELKVISKYKSFYRDNEISLITKKRDFK